MGLLEAEPEIRIWLLFRKNLCGSEGSRIGEGKEPVKDVVSGKVRPYSLMLRGKMGCLGRETSGVCTLPQDHPS